MYARYQITKHTNCKLQHNRYRQKIKMQDAAQRVIVSMTQKRVALCKHSPERSCTRTISNAYCYTNTGSNSNLNNSNAFTPMLKKMMYNIFFQALAKKVLEEQALK